MRSRETMTTIIAAILVVSTNTVFALDALWPSKTHYRYQDVNDNRIFYREAGTKSPDKPTIVLLHGWPTSSHYFRELIPLLSGRYHVIAPDNLGSGYSYRPDPNEVAYTFDLLADHLDGLLIALEINEYVFYIHDFGAPVGFRTMVRDPKKLKGIIAQNGVTHMEGLSGGANEFFEKSHKDRSPVHVTEMNSWGGKAVIDSHKRNVAGREEGMSPDAWVHDNTVMATENGRRIQTQLFQDYHNNLKAYPEWQSFLRKHQPPTLVVWGTRDKFFVTAGGEAYKKEVPQAEVRLLGAGHYALEEEQVAIAKHIVHFMNKLPSKNNE